jgi:hypothetical protein
LFADVLEHLKDPWTAFSRAVDFLREDGTLIVSVPNVAHSSILLALLHDQFILDDTGLLDRTHLRFFTFESAKKLCRHPALDLYEMNATYRHAVQTEVFKHAPPVPSELIDLVSRKLHGDIFQYIFYLKKRSADSTKAVKVVNKIVPHDLFEQQLNLVEPEAFWAEAADGFVAENRVAASFNRENCEFALKLPPRAPCDPLWLRFDPCSVSAILEIQDIRLHMQDRDRKLSVYSHNGANFTENILIFDQTDPKIVIRIDNPEQAFRISIKIDFLTINWVPSKKQHAMEHYWERRRVPNIPRMMTDPLQNGAGARYHSICEQRIAYLNTRVQELEKKETELYQLNAKVQELEKKETELYQLNAKVQELEKKEIEFYAAYKALKEERDRLQEKFSHRAVMFAYRLNQVQHSAKWLLLLPVFILASPAIFAGIVLRGKRRIPIILARARELMNLLKNKKRLKLEMRYPKITKPVGFEQVYMLRHKLRTIPVRRIKAPQEVIRFNILVPTLRPEIIFGGYISLLHFVKRLSRKDCVIRIVICDDPELTKIRLIKKWTHKADIQHLLSVSDFDNLDGYSESAPFPVCEQDRFIAYSGWEGLIAHQLVAYTNYKKFIFFIQEYEPIFHDENAIKAVLQSAYYLPHFPIFNTRILHNHFVQDKLGIYSDAYATGKGIRDEDHMVFEHAIADLIPPSSDELEKRTIRKLLFYARPEPHAGRNLYALGMLALGRALEKGLFKGAWEFWGIGTFAEDYEVQLDAYHTMKIVQRIPQKDYEQFLKNFDVGFSLMMAPHPSILPFEMAAAGLVVVTNEYRHRNRNVIAGISNNILPCRLTLDSIAEALGAAARKSADYNSRVKDYGVDWNRSWDNAFSDEFLESFISKVS